MKIISMDVMSTGVIAYYVLIASRDGLFTPILANGNIRELRRSGSPGGDLDGDRHRLFDSSTDASWGNEIGTG